MARTAFHRGTHNFAAQRPLLGFEIFLLPIAFGAPLACFEAFLLPHVEAGRVVCPEEIVRVVVDQVLAERVEV